MTGKKKPEDLPENTAPKGEERDLPEPSPNFDPTAVESQSPTGKAPVKSVNEAAENKPQPAPIAHSSRPVTPGEERTWAMLAHLSVLLNLVTGFLGGVAALIIYFAYKDRSRLVAYHAMQSFIFQAITWLGASLVSGILIAGGSALSFLIIPLLCLIPGFLILLLPPASLIYGVIGGVKVNNGEDFRYWQVGDWVRDIIEPKPTPEE